MFLLPEDLSLYSRGSSELVQLFGFSPMGGDGEGGGRSNTSNHHLSNSQDGMILDGSSNENNDPSDGSSSLSDLDVDMLASLWVILTSPYDCSLLMRYLNDPHSQPYQITYAPYSTNNSHKNACVACVYRRGKCRWK